MSVGILDKAYSQVAEVTSSRLSTLMGRDVEVCIATEVETNTRIASIYGREMRVAD